MNIKFMLKRYFRFKWKNTKSWKKSKKNK